MADLRFDPEDDLSGGDLTRIDELENERDSRIISARDGQGRLLRGEALRDALEAELKDDGLL